MELVKLDIETKGIESKETGIKINIEGMSNMPFWNQDLQIKGAITLLEYIDIKRFFENGTEDEYFELLDELENIVKSLKNL